MCQLIRYLINFVIKFLKIQIIVVLQNLKKDIWFEVVEGLIAHLTYYFTWLNIMELKYINDKW